MPRDEPAIMVLRYTCIVGSLIEARLFGSMEEDEECAYDHTLIDGYSPLRWLINQRGLPLFSFLATIVPIPERGE